MSETGRNFDLKAPYKIAEKFRAEKYGTNSHATLYCHGDILYRWNGKIYTPVEQREIASELYHYIDGTFDFGGNRIKSSPGKINELLELLKTVALLTKKVEAPAWLNGGNQPPAIDMIACDNGLLYPFTRELQPHTPLFFNHNVLTFCFNSDATAPRWQGFLAELWGDDTESIETLQEIFGYCLTADVSQEKIFFITGPKRAGKGTILKVLQALVGIENSIWPTLGSLGERFGLEPLVRKRLVIISDLRLDARKSTIPLVEMLLRISGRDYVVAEKKNISERWEGQLRTRIVIASNEVPRLEDSSGVIESRIIPLKLSVSFYGREDLSLSRDLMRELPGILNWALTGLLRLRERGYFRRPASARKVERRLAEVSNFDAAFMDQCCERGPECKVVYDDLYSAFKEFCIDRDRPYPPTEQIFARNHLRPTYPDIETRQVTNPKTGKRERVYCGITLNVTGLKLLQDYRDRTKGASTNA